MNKRYEEGREPFFSESGETMRKQYVWVKDEKGKEVLQETAPIDIQQEIESYSDECDIKNIVRKASFDPQFLKSLSQGALDGTEASSSCKYSTTALSRFACSVSLFKLVALTIASLVYLPSPPYLPIS